MNNTTPTPTGLDPEAFEDVLRLVLQASPSQLQQINNQITRQYNVERAQKTREVGAQLRLGQSVRIVGSTRPKYLAYQTGEVIDIKESRAHIKLDRGPQGKFRNGIVVAPFSMLEVLG